MAASLIGVPPADATIVVVGPVPSPFVDEKDSVPCATETLIVSRHAFRACDISENFFFPPENLLKARADPLHCVEHITAT